MNRKEFMIQLEKLLGDIPQEERIEALAYYNGYFEDAGEENEEKIIQELESPEKVAKIIRADIGVEEQPGQEQRGEYTENGYRDQRFDEHQEVGARKAPFQEAEKDDGRSQSGMDNTAKVVLIVLAAILTSPIWLGLLGGAIGLVVGVLAAVCGVAIAALALVFAFYIIGVVLIGVGIGLFAGGAVAGGFCLSGTGFLMLALAVLGTIACVWLFGKLLPWLINGTVQLCGRIFHRRGRAQ